MRKTKILTEKKRVEKTLDILCNLCGKSCCTGNLAAKIDPKNKKITKGPAENNVYDGLIEAEVQGGFDSNLLGDMTSYRFSLCEECLMKIFSKFKIPVEIRDDNMSSQFVSQIQYEKNKVKKNKKKV